MIQVNAILIDDETHCRQGLTEMLALYCPNVEVRGMAESVDEGIQLLQQTPCDVLFLDIQLGNQTGFDLLDQIGEREFQLIFVTAYDHFALKAFAYHAQNYILKPIVPEKLIEAVSKLAPTQDNQLLKHLADSFRKRELPSRLTVPTSEGYSFIKIEDITRCEAERGYTTIFKQGGDKVVSSKPLREYEDLLCEKTFFRIHKSHLINLNFVDQYFKRRAGGEVKMEDGILLEVAKRRKDEFIDALSRF